MCACTVKPDTRLPGKNREVVSSYMYLLVCVRMCTLHSSHIHAQLLPLVTVENDDEVGRLVKITCSRFAHTELSPESIPLAFAALEKVGMIYCIVKFS